MTGIKPRLLCVQTLMRTIEAKSYGNLALHGALAASELSAQDKRLCTVLFQGTLERLITLDACIAAHSKRPPEKLDPAVLCVLRCGIYELFCLHTQSAAAVNLWTETVKRLHKTSAAGMVNAVLRAFLRSGRQIPLPKEETAAISVRYSIPEPLVRLLCKDYPADIVTDFLEDTLGEPPIYLRRNPLLCSEEEFLASFPADTVTPVAGIPFAYAMRRGGSLTDTDAFRNGWFHVQDLASQLCALALDAQPGDTVLDVCAAPGGKSFTIAEQMQGRGQVLAYDLHPSRVKLIADGAKRLGLQTVTAMTGDARNPAADRPVADRILCDVPCSGYGVMRRKPELRYKLPEESAALPDIQYEILEQSARSLRAGGILVYSTCTLLKRENEQVAERFLAAHPEFTAELPWQDIPALADIAKPMTTLLPQMLGSDGFFITRLRRQ